GTDHARVGRRGRGRIRVLASARPRARPHVPGAGRLARRRARARRSGLRRRLPRVARARGRDAARAAETPVSVPRMLDPEGAHIAALCRLADFSGQTVLELGCGDGRLTLGIAADAASVLAFDPDAEAV